MIVQECGVGLVPVREVEHGLAFAAPPLLRSGPLEEALTQRIAGILGIDRGEIVDAAWADNGLALDRASCSPTPMPCSRSRPASASSTSASSARTATGSPRPTSRCARSSRRTARVVEDPVTGSLNASLAQWLLGTGRAHAPYVARQGTALGRSGRVHISTDADGAIWVGGGTVACITGTVDL